MPLVLPTVGEVDVLSYYVNSRSPENLILRLYSNDYTPGPTSKASDFTEVTGGGYTPRVLAGASWKVKAGALGLPTVAEFAKQTFVFTGDAGTVYGYFTTREGSGRIAHAERFAEPFRVLYNGDEVKVTPKVEVIKTNN